ncbi:hypothetical protein L7F22_036116 [Adiantum nelumboides]|nr:hypothetical protein [Adiantum nelumboides]
MSSAAQTCPCPSPYDAVELWPVVSQKFVAVWFWGLAVAVLCTFCSVCGHIWVFGTLEIVNLNSLDIQYNCDNCKGGNVSCQLSNPFCFFCGKLVSIVKTPILQAKLIAQAGEDVIVTLQGVIVDDVLGLSQPFMQLYENNLADLKASLAMLKKLGTCEIDMQGNLIDFKHA